MYVEKLLPSSNDVQNRIGKTANNIFFTVPKVQPVFREYAIGEEKTK